MDMNAKDVFLATSVADFTTSIVLAFMLFFMYLFYKYGERAPKTEEYSDFKTAVSIVSIVVGSIPATALVVHFNSAVKNFMLYLSL